jgi:hypothetical protein
VSNTADIQEAINASARQSNCGLIVMGGTITAANREAIVRLAAQHRVPAIYANRYYVTMAEGDMRGAFLARKRPNILIRVHAI